MTYTHKLARRLAISRNLAMFHVLALVAACAGETTAPEGPASPNAPASPTSDVGFRVMPGTVTIETDQRIRFRGEYKAQLGRFSPPTLKWEASGGNIDSRGTFYSSRPGTFRVVARGVVRGRGHWHRPDTSIVIVVPRQPGVAQIRVTPRTPRLEPGEKRRFSAVGKLRNGGDATVGVVWSATGGSINPDGLYIAGSQVGKYRVIAANPRGTLADTIEVRVRVPNSPEPPDTTDVTPDPEPEPDPDPTPAVARVVLKPASVQLATRATHQFAAFGRSSAGDSVAVDVTFHATGGTITPSGLYTAGSTAGDYRVIARASQLADTAVITIARTSGGGTPIPEPPPLPGPGRGIPFGPFAIMNTRTEVAPFSMAMQDVRANTIVDKLRQARAANARLMLMMTGGAHENYMSGGTFDRSKWEARMREYDTPAIRQAIAEAVADGTIVGNSVMDEPHVHGGGDGNTWGPEGTMTKARVDGLCAYAKQMFPTMPIGVLHRHDIFEPENSYRSCDFIISQYSNRIGSVTGFRDAGLALARRDGHAIMFSLNILNGGEQDKSGAWDCPDSEPGTFGNNCRMTASQVREYGYTLGPAGCGLVMWKYDSRFMARSDNEQAFRDVAARLNSLPAPPCRRR